MNKEITKTEFVGILVDLAKDMDIKDSVDFASLNISKDQAFELMANTVIEQFFVVPEDQREVVMLASLVKLLVENLVLNAKLQGVK